MADLRDDQINAIVREVAELRQTNTRLSGEVERLTAALALANGAWAGARERADALEEENTPLVASLRELKNWLLGKEEDAGNAFRIAVQHGDTEHQSYQGGRRDGYRAVLEHVDFDAFLGKPAVTGTTSEGK